MEDATLQELRDWLESEREATTVQMDKTAMRDNILWTAYYNKHLTLLDVANKIAELLKQEQIYAKR